MKIKEKELERLENFLSQIKRTTSNEQILTEINQNLNLIIAVESFHKQLRCNISISTEIISLLENTISDIAETAKKIKNDNYSQISEILIDLQFIASSINLNFITESIQKILESQLFMSKEKDLFIYNLGKEIEKEDSVYAFEILNNFRQFKMISIERLKT